MNDITQTLHFIKNSNLFIYGFSSNNLQSFFSFYENSSNNKILFYIPDENLNAVRSYESKLDFDKFISLVQRGKGDILITQTTSSTGSFFCHPIVNLSNWYDRYKFQTGAKNNNNDPIKEINKNLKEYDTSKIFQKNKNIFLWMNKQSKSRDLIFQSILANNNIEICSKYNHLNYNRLSDSNNTIGSKTFIPTDDLINKQKESLITSVVETISSTENDIGNINEMTEKTMMAFLHQTMPILHGGSNFIEEIENIGFYVFNNDFRYQMKYDSLQIFDVEKINEFNVIINKLLNTPFEEIKSVYQENWRKIQHNYFLAREILIDGKYSIFNNRS